MKINRLARQYVAFKQSIGMRFRSEASTLRSFCRAVGDIDIAEVKPGSVLAFISGKGPVTSFWHQKYTILGGFYRFVMARRYIDASPLPLTVPKRPPPLTPYIYTPEQLRRLLLETNHLVSTNSPLQALTFHTLLLTLYGTGLRISEALSLRLADVDCPQSLITVHSSKFYKTRLVPIGPRLTAILSDYAKRRRQLPSSAGEASSFFATRTGHALSYGRARRLFRLVRARSGIRREEGARYQPRLHDFRHSFAVHRLLAWYREGADVQRRLPQLATYLGHVGIDETQRYLTMTPDLLQEANRRFESYMRSEGHHG